MRAPGARPAMAATVATAFLLAQLTSAAAVEVAGRLRLRIICLNFERVQVMWDPSGEASGSNLTLLYRFSEDQDEVPCPSYRLHEGRTCGCLLPEGGDRILYLTLSSGTQRLVTTSQWLSEHLKPAPPGNVSIRWREEAVAVACAHLPYRGLIYEVQYRGTFDTEWQSLEAETCNLTSNNLDSEKCYSFRVRVRTKEAVYGSEAQPSDWTAVSYWERGQPQDSCLKQEPLPAPRTPAMMWVCGLAACLMLGLVFLSLWKLHRVKSFLVPAVPDPKSSFPGLFEIHQGDFQGWISDTQNLASPGPTADASTTDHMLVTHLSQVDLHVPELSRTRCSKNPGDNGALCPRSPLLPSTGTVHLGGFQFTQADGHYWCCDEGLRSQQALPDQTTP